MPTGVGETSPVLDTVSFADSPVEYVRTLYVNFLMAVFAHQPPGEYHWAPGDETEIWISNESPIDGSKMGQRPAITLTRGPMSMFSASIDALKSTNFETGGKTREVLVPGNMSINCISRTQLECERIAFWVAGQLLAGRNYLVSRPGMFDAGLNAQVGTPSPAGSLVAGDSGAGWFVCSVTSPFTFVWSQKMTPLNRRIVQDLIMRTRYRHRVGQHTAVNDGFTHEVALSTCEHGPESFSPAADARGQDTDPAGLRKVTLERIDTAPNPASTSRVIVVRKPPQRRVRPDSYVPFTNRCVEESTTQPLGTTEIKVR